MHNLNFSRGEASFVNAGTKKIAWHNLGKHIPDRLLTAEEAMVSAQLDFEVRMAELYCKLPSGEVCTPLFTTYRTDTNEIFDKAVTKRFEILQNREAFSWFDSILQTGEAIISTAGCLGKGETVFITAQLPENIIVGKDDEVERYLLLKHSHDGTGAVTAMFTPVRVVCQNTLNLAMSTGQAVAIRHTTNLRQNLESAKTLLGITKKATQIAKEQFNFLIGKPLSDRELRNLIASALTPGGRVFTDYDPNDPTISTRFVNQVNACNMYAFTDNTQPSAGTRWWGYNAVTGFLQHQQNFKNSDARFKAIFGGTAAAASEKALNLLLTN